jgi:NADPH-dependent 2,4-dienoyl-CoA reductase/sulfur reductase-like enzyme
LIDPSRKADVVNKSEILVIGGGPAGITFSAKVKKLNPDRSITLLRSEEHSMVYCAIPYAIEGLFQPEKVFKRDALVTDIGVRLVKRKVVSVDLHAKRVVDDAGEEYTANIFFLATGASPLRPSLKGAHAENVYTVKTQQDMEALIAKLAAGARRAVVVGAGAIGIEQATAYQARGLDTYLIDMASRVVPSMLDEDMAEKVHTALKAKGIHLLLSTRVTHFELEGHRVKAVAMSDGARIELNPERDFVCFAVGMKADVNLFAEQGLEINKSGIVVDSRMRTNISGVYAAGDCCSYISIIDGKPVDGKLATNAVPMAKIAARVVCGKDDEYSGFVNGAATCAYEWRMGSTGFTAEAAEQRGFKTVIGWGETTTLFPMMPGAGALKVKVVADARDLRIIGAQVLSTLPVTDKIDTLTLAIQRRLTLKGLTRLSYSAQPWQSFFPARNAIVEACENALDNFVAKGEPFHYPEVLECV